MSLEAEQSYRKALDNNYNLIHAHYNLAAIYASQKDIDKASRCIEHCLRINKNFQPAANAKKELERSRKIDWMSWFDFSQRVRLVVGMTLTILMVVEQTNENKSPTTIPNNSILTTLSESIYRLGHSDVFACHNCIQRGDKWFMIKHRCKGGVH
jgi:tetratricopeptide (TPR) repeat protein